MLVAELTSIIFISS